MNQALHILLMCNRPIANKNASTIIDHIDAFARYSKHHIYLFSNILTYPEKLNLKKFDVLIVHYSLSLLGNFYLSENAKKNISNFKGLKVVFIQDEYRRINTIHAEIRKLGFDILYTCVPSLEIEKVYPTALFPTLKKINTLTGYIPENLLSENVPLLKDRPIQVGYRARKVPFWLGSLGAEKFQIVDTFYKYTKNYKLQIDLSYKENNRYYGKQWTHFICSCKTMLGVESGSSIVDFTGELEKHVEKYRIYHPLASFEKIYELFLKNHEGKIILNQISPRCFEAIALKTVLILYEGEYSGILKAWQHYIPLKKDFSNINTVIDCIHSIDTLQKIADDAYHEIALNNLYSYKNFICNFDGIVSNEVSLRKINRINLPYTQDCFLVASNSFKLKDILLKKIKLYRRSVFRIIPELMKRLVRSLYFIFLDKSNV
ncbi:MAG: hypothetical protein REH83_03615 [Rickettsiella sp.]|nr:hypothetical protein [Rickettsiella sp.]